MDQRSKRCPICNKPMIFALPSGGGRRAFQCPDCDQPDPLKSEIAKGWLEGELGREKRADEK
jgi:tRNA(Ile2) C34 agmatinyltransferase TiaS